MTGASSDVRKESVGWRKALERTAGEMILRWWIALRIAGPIRSMCHQYAKLKSESPDLDSKKAARDTVRKRYEGIDPDSAKRRAVDHAFNVVSDLYDACGLAVCVETRTNYRDVDQRFTEVVSAKIIDSVDRHMHWTSRTVKSRREMISKLRRMSAPPAPGP